MIKIEVENKFKKSSKDIPNKRETTRKHRVKISEVLPHVAEDMEIEGVSLRTINDYLYHFNRLCKLYDIEYLDSLNRKILYNYLTYNDVSKSTQRIRLKHIRAILNRLESKGLVNDFWSTIKIKVDDKIKEGVTKEEMHTLLGLLDFTNYSEFRDACMFLMMFETGLRIGTLSKLTEPMINLNDKLVTVSGDIMKNYNSLSLPLSDTLSEMLQGLMIVNEDVRRVNRTVSDLLFLTHRGKSMISKSGSNMFSQRISGYRERFKLKNINPHAIRRGFARRLLDNGLSVPVISKALNHKSIDTTTRYLHIDNKEIIEAIRDIE